MKKVLFLLLALSAATTLWAQTTYTVGVPDIDYSPLLTTKDGQVSGFIVDLLNEFAKSKGIKFTFLPMPTSRVKEKFYNDKSLDFRYPENPEWDKDVKQTIQPKYSDPIINYIEGIMVKPEKNGKISNLKSIGTIRGFTIVPYVDLVKSGTISVSEADSISSLIQMGIAGRVDGIYANEIIIKYNLFTMKQENALVLDTTLKSSTGYYTIATLKYGKIMEDLNAYMKSNIKLITDLKKKWNMN